MIRQLGVVLVAGLVAGCLPAPATSPAATGPRPTVPSSASPVAPSPSRIAVLPSPTAPDCLPFDLSKQSQPSVWIDPAYNPNRDEAYGLDGSGQLGADRFDVGPWHQPAPGAALVVGRGALLVLHADLGDPDELPTCLGSVALDLAPYSDSAATPPADTVGHLSAKVDTEPAASFAFAGPSAAGEWILRATISFPTSPGPSSIESFFRLQVDVPAPAVGGTASRPYRCGAPGANPPAAFLAAGARTRVAAERGSSDWRLAAADGPAPPGAVVQAHVGDPLVITIEDNVCAGWWGVDVAPPALHDFSGREPFRDLVPGHAEGEAVSPVRVNRWRLAELPAGDWWVMANLEFPEAGSNDAVGLTTNFWHVVVR